MTAWPFRLFALLPSCLFALLPALAWAQPGAAVPPARVTILQIEERRAPTPRDLTTLRTAVRNRDPLTAILAIRAIGRLERPSLIADLLPALRFPLPETRAEAANAIGQAAQGWRTAKTLTTAVTPATLLTTLTARLADEEDPGVRAALCETIGRLPYRSAREVERAEAALVDLADRSDAVQDRLGVTRGFEALVRLHREIGPPGAPAIATLRALSGVTGDEPPVPGSDPLRDSRVRRLALEALIAARAFDEDLVVRTSVDPDAQVRRLAMRAATLSGLGTGVLARGLDDPAAMVRLEALGGFKARRDEAACHVFIAAAADPEPHVALVGIDQLAACGSSPDAVSFLERAVNDAVGPSFSSGVTPDLKVGPTATMSPRGWHRAAHAIVALAGAAPDRAAAALGQFIESKVWQLRVHAARAAAVLNDRRLLETLAADASDNVVEAAIEGLSKVAGHETDPIYVGALSRTGYQAIRAAALALAGTPHRTDAVPALEAAWRRLVDENRANSSDTRAAIAAALTRIGAPPPAPRPAPATAAPQSVLNAAELRRLAAPRARITIRDLGAIEFALFTSEAPGTVLRFAALAESGYYNGLTFHRVMPNFVIQGGSPGANEYVGTADFMRDEVGLWPHVRGAVGISTRGRDTGDGQIFIDLVDNPRFDHEYTVFAQVLNGTDVLDRILEGDVIDLIEILP
jgi:cyclophilin family peptidyl-prolyl cis-trans isomerase